MLTGFNYPSRSSYRVGGFYFETGSIVKTPPMSNLRLVTVCEDVEGFPRRIQAGQAGGFRRDGPPALERRLQGGGPVGDHAQRLAPHRHHLSPLRPWLVGVGLLDCRGQKRMTSECRGFGRVARGNIQAQERRCDHTDNTQFPSQAWRMCGWPASSSDSRRSLSVRAQLTHKKKAER